MPQPRPQKKRWHLRDPLRMGVGAFALAALASLASPAFGQSLTELRGALGEDARTDGEQAPEATFPTYRPDPPPPDIRADPFADDWPQPATPSSPPRGSARSEANEPGSESGRVEALSGLETNENAPRAGAENLRVGAIGQSARSPAGDDPFAPLGLRLGSFVLRPTIDQGIGSTSNADYVRQGRSAIFSETAGRFTLESDWALHAARLEADGLVRRSLSGAAISEAEGGITGSLRLDLLDGFAVEASAGYRARPESATSPVDIGVTESRPLRQTTTASLGLSRDTGRVRLGLTGAATRDTYGAARLQDGGSLDQSDRDATLASLRLRTGYALSPALTPFVEGEIGRRFHDRGRDTAGFARSANRHSAGAGLEFDLGEKFRGEVSGGWLGEKPDDARLRAVRGPYAAALVEWSPQRGTVIGLRGTTTVETTTTPGESGSLLYAGELSLSRQMRHNLTATALLGLEWRDYQGTGARDFLWYGEARATWWFNRMAGLSGRARHERLDSTIDGRGYEASSVYLGLTLRR